MLRNGCQRLGLQGRTSTTLDHEDGPQPFWTTRGCYLIIKEKLLPFRLRIELTEVLYIPWIGQRHSFFCGEVNAPGPAYFQHLEGSLPAGGEIVKPFVVQDSLED